MRVWPFPDEQAFWTWAADPDAELMEQDEDLLLHDPEGLSLLLCAAEDVDCPKQSYCAAILQDYARHVVSWKVEDAYLPLQTVAGRAAASSDVWVRRWAEYVNRLSSYLGGIGPVNRANAAQMSADLLACPADRLTIQVAPGEKYWQCVELGAYPRYLYINRRTGEYQLVGARPLTRHELTRLHR